MDKMWLSIVGFKLTMDNETMSFAEKWIEFEITSSKLSEVQKLYIWEEEGGRLKSVINVCMTR